MILWKSYCFSILTLLLALWFVSVPSRYTFLTEVSR